MLDLAKRRGYFEKNSYVEISGMKSSDERKPMVLKGARRVGKTWLMKEFGKNYYKSFV